MTSRLPGRLPDLRAIALLAAAALACGGSASKTSTANSTPPVTQTAPPSPQPDGRDSGTPADPGTDAGTVADAGTAGAPPAPTLTGVAQGSVVSGHVALTAGVATGTSKVEFAVDGATLATVTAAPFVTTWDSFSAANGAHSLSLKATDAAGSVTTSEAVAVSLQNHIKNVFVIVMENSDWSSIKGSSAAPYINGTLLQMGAHAEKYMNVPGLHPSLPNYLWLESGSNQGVTDDDVPANHQLTTTKHLTTLLANAGHAWKAYQEDISGTNCPLDYVQRYAPKHDPMAYFTDVNSGANGPADPTSATCIAHIRPYSELVNDLESNTVPAYSFITPNLCNDMHDCGTAAGDTWLSTEVPKILASKAYREGGALFITWDESAGSQVPIGFIALSPLGKVNYTSQVSYTHSSTLRSLQEIFGVTPFLNDAANATDLADLFRTFP